jgi:hypothetical protein
MLIKSLAGCPLQASRTLTRKGAHSPKPRYQASRDRFRWRIRDSGLLVALSRCVYRKTVPAESQGRRIPRAVLCEISEVIMRSWDPKRTPDSYCVVYAAAVATPVAQTQSHASLVYSRGHLPVSSVLSSVQKRGVAPGV